MASVIVVSIPIELENRGIFNALLNKYGTDYLFIGRILCRATTNQSCEINVSSISSDNRDLAQAIEIAGQDKVDLHTLEVISQSRQTVQLVSFDVGYQACLTIAHFTQVFLNIGGIAVNIESGSIAHQAERWLAKYNSQDVFDIYSLYVGLVEGENIYYSCGMQNFGKADVSLDITEDTGLAIYVMNVFNYYRLTESPILQDGHTFQPDIESPSYRIKLVEDREYEPDSLQHNLLGRWHLQRC